MSNMPPGWYPAPENPRMQRWWNGSGWSDIYNPETAYLRQDGDVPAQPKRSNLGVILGIGGGVIALGIIGLLVAGFVLSGLVSGANNAGSNDRPAASGEPSDSGQASLAEWEALKERYDSEYNTYKAANGTSDMYNYAPDTDKGREYYTAFFYILIDYKTALGFVELGVDTMNPAELASTIDEYETMLDELLDTFLANEDLDTDIKISRSDGTVFESDGSAP